MEGLLLHSGYPGRGSCRLAELRYLFLRPSFPPFLLLPGEDGLAVVISHPGSLFSYIMLR